MIGLEEKRELAKLETVDFPFRESYTKIMRINSVLDEIYHPFLDCIPKQSDALKVYHKTRKNKPNTGVSPSYDVPFQGTFALPLTENTFFKLQFVKIEP
ncbi:hypothetical protein H8356DRAFT_1360727 [Neocallimastix lanati (nom. inval.)]|nr:hypothetical protein H8356DRAFT_1360727 [Neocallimastix sp. JGI-2020a]